MSNNLQIKDFNPPKVSLTVFLKNPRVYKMSDIQQPRTCPNPPSMNCLVMEILKKQNPNAVRFDCTSCGKSIWL